MTWTWTWMDWSLPDWSSPYLITVLSLMAALGFIYVVVMVVTGCRHRVLTRRLEQTKSAFDVSTCTPEQWALLASGEQRLVEVVLLRLYLERQVVLNRGALALAKDAAVTHDSAASDDELTVRQAMLRMLRTGKSTRVTDVLDARKYDGNIGAACRRLAKLKLWEESAVRNAKVRERVHGAYMALLALGMSMSSNTAAISIVIMICVATIMLTWGVAFAPTGGLIHPSRPVRTGLVLTKQSHSRPGTSCDSLLRYVALHGLIELSMFEQAPHYGKPDAELNDQEMKSTYAFASALTCDRYSHDRCKFQILEYSHDLAVSAEVKMRINR